MTLVVLDRHVALEGTISAEEAEELMSHLSAMAQPAVALSACGHIHAAVLQVLLAWRPRIDKAPPDPFLAAALAESDHGEPS